MRAIHFDKPRDLSSLHLVEVSDPVLKPGHVLVHLGLELAGTVLDTAPDVTGFSGGDNVCALVNGGGFAQLAAVPQNMLLRLPERLSFTKAAAIPEVWLTAYQALHWIAKIQSGQHVLIHAGASGVGTAAIQLVRLAGAIPIVTATKSKHARLEDLGAEHCIDYRNEDFDDVVLKLTNGKGVEILLDYIGAPYVTKNINAIALDGHIVLQGFLGGRYVQNVDMAPFLTKRIRFTGSTLRNRLDSYKEALVADFNLAHVRRAQ